ncbi:DHS-like NAD/FAD-binding domain-containing protein [Phlebopus sp. FC_14]|nr:DHS-like NAD/FAD-binding domain-containing protein [Phlebopus sp. FC_14]
MSVDQKNPPHQATQRGAQEMNALHALQLRAFLGAEDVDADSDVIDDLLDGISDDFCGDIAEYDSELEASETDLPLTVHEQRVPAGSDPYPSDDGVIDIDASELRALKQEAEDPWTQDEIKKMLHHLKEHGMGSFTKEYVVTQNIPIVKLLFAFGISLCPELRNKGPKTLLYFLRVAMSRELHLREKLPQYNTISDAVSLIRNAQNIVVLTGAGISVSCGIPDFRSRNGLYATLKQKGEYDLDDPQQMFDIHYFRDNPAVFYSFASQIYPSNFTPSACHRFIKVIEDKNKLLRNYTQNIDTLESQAGISRVLQCHGSFKTATCLLCRSKVPGIEIEREILEQRVPYCKGCLEARKAHEYESQKRKCVKRKRKKRKEWEEDSDESDDLPMGIMKPDITFFGEKLTDEFDQALIDDRETVDLLLVIGTSLKVSPVSEILSHLPHSVPQILINKTPIRHINPDVVLLGNADDIVQDLCQRLGWDLPSPSRMNGHLHVPTTEGKSVKRTSTEMVGRVEPVRVGDSHVWLFDGAEGGKWVQNIEEKSRNETAPNGSASQSSQGPETKKVRIS